MAVNGNHRTYKCGACGHENKDDNVNPVICPRCGVGRMKPYLGETV